MTTLITAALIVFGIFGYRLLSVAALPAVDFPTIQITADAAGREPGNHGRLGRRADRAAALDHRRHHLAHLDLVARLEHHHHPVRPQPEHRRRRPRRADRAHRGGAPAAGRDDDSAVFPQGQSGRFRDPAVQPGVADAAAVGGRRLCRDHAGAADFPAAGHRPGAGVRRAEIRRPRPGRSRGRRGGARHLARRRAQRGGQGEFEHAGRHHRRAQTRTPRSRRAPRCGTPTNTRTSSSPIATGCRSRSARSPR